MNEIVRQLIGIYAVLVNKRFKLNHKRKHRNYPSRQVVHTPVRNEALSTMLYAPLPNKNILIYNQKIPDHISGVSSVQVKPPKHCVSTLLHICKQLSVMIYVTISEQW